MDPTNVGNQGKWVGFESIGWNVQDEASRQVAAQDIIDQLKTKLAYFPAKRGRTSALRLPLGDYTKGR